MRKHSPRTFFQIAVSEAPFGWKYKSCFHKFRKKSLLEKLSCFQPISRIQEGLSVLAGNLELFPQTGIVEVQSCLQIPAGKSKQLIFSENLMEIRSCFLIFSSRVV